jgi:replicative DNA helicase
MTDSLTVFQDISTEWRCLSSLIDPKNDEWVNRISSALFTGKRTDVFKAMQDSYALYGSISWEGIRTHLDGNVPNELAAASGGNIRASVDELVRLARKRQAQQKAATFKELADQHNPKLDALQSAAIVDPILADEDSSLVHGAQTFLTDLTRKRSGEYRLTRSGFKFFDKSFGGEYKSKTLIIYAGGPGAGKTTLVAQSMLNMAEGYVNERTGEKITTSSLFLSFEMSKSDIMLKWLGNKLSINTQNILSGALDDEQFQQIEEETVRLQRLPMYIIDNPSMTLGQMVYEIRKHVYKYGVKVVFIDYLQIVNYSPTGQPNKDLGDFAWHMKELAKKEDITIVILSQITPSNDGVFRIRNSGEVSAHADAIFEGELETDELTPLKTVNVNRTKNRLGPIGKCVLHFNAQYQRFEEND